MGFRLYSSAAIKKQINERQSSISGMVKMIQTKIFKFLFNYEASNTYAASEEKENEKVYYQVIVYLYETMEGTMFRFT